jgi:N-sulfoglucosamine sulfohydrolase
VFTYTIPPAPILDAPETRYDAASFKATARELDRGMGAVLDALESRGLAENTLVICTTDHGIAFPEMKCNLTVHGTGVFLIMRGPGGFAGGKICDTMISQLDLYPTICDLVNIEHPAWLQGKSLMPLIRGEAAQHHEEIFAEINYHAAYEPKRAVRTPRWNYIKRFGDRTHPVLPNCDDGPSKSLWLQTGWKDRTDPEERLYDTFFDPNERYNLAKDPAYASTLNEMRGRLSAWMERTGDPLLRGPVKAPAGAVVNDPNGISPREKPRPA